ncbi:MAG: isoquinoline 1-oxidoreductase subunit beta IorB, molybdoprotein [Frankiales bacterium]|nr:isoquinoline 1-oxidoreductase subunit beta IorB, molybdoprotein [Frankiales bacterium]
MSAVSRRSFLTGTVGVAVSFVLLPAGPAVARSVAAAPAGRMRIEESTSPTSLAWLVLTPEAITVYCGKVELGTGIQTAMSQVVVEELRLTVADVRYVQADTLLTPSQGTTAGSKSLQEGAEPLRHAAATAFAALQRMAAQHLGTADAPERVKARDGAFSWGNRTVTYAALLAEADLETVADLTVPLVATADLKVVGRSVPRVDLPAKLRATFTYVADVSLPGMLHGRVIRPSGRNATLRSVDKAPPMSVPGVTDVVVVGNVVGVVATGEAAAARAAQSAGSWALWNAGPAMLPWATLEDELRSPANWYAEVAEAPLRRGNAPAVLASGGTVLERNYFTPFLMHAAMGASASVADVRAAPDPLTGIRATVWSGSQNVTNLRGAIADLLGLPAAQVRVVYTEASGCYGHNGADDCAADAALLSKAVGRPVRVQWTRQQEHGWEPQGPASAHTLKGKIGATGIEAWWHTLYAPTHGSRPVATNAGTLVAGQLTGKLPAALPATAANSAGRNSQVTYARIPHHQVDAKLVRSFTTVPGGRAPATTGFAWKLPRSTSLRSLGGFSNTFANESFFDELAAAGGRDPLELRIAMHEDSRAVAVLAALRPAWTGRPTSGGRGAGVAFQQYELENAYAATYAEVVVDAGGTVRVTRMVCAHDCGRVVNPDGLRNQIEGNLVQGVSRALKEETVWRNDTVTTTVWQPAPPFSLAPQYAVLRFDEVPEIECIVIDRPDEPMWGAGEPAIGTVGAAVANAVFAAVGARVRRLPITPERVQAARPHA